ncbi:MAG: phosphoglycerate dehydrogenase [Bacillota bacterium]
MEIKIKVLISDPISQEGVKLLEKEVEVDIRPDLTAEELKEEIGQYDGIIVRSGTTLDKETIERADNLKVIGRAGTGYDNIDISAATKKGIIVFNTPNANTISAVEHTIGMMLALARNIPQAHDSTIQGKWERKKYKGVEVYGKTLGVIGLGKIGSLVAQRAQSLGMKVIGYDKYVSQKHADEINVDLVTMEELLNKSDFITLHTPLTDETYHLLGEEEFKQMKEGVRIINCARGGNIDSAALARALEEGKVAGAAMDAHEEEPFDPEEYPLAQYEDKVIMTCHLGASTTEAMDRVAENAAEQLLDVLNGEMPLSPLNIGDLDPSDLSSKTELELAEKLGKFLSGCIASSKINNIEVEYMKDTADSKNELIMIYVVKEILNPVLKGRINMVNALLMAEERGIGIKRSFVDKPSGFNYYLKINVITDQGTFSVTGDLEASGPQLVEVDGYRVEQKLAGKFLLLFYEDRPGVIGKVGSILGENDINIGSMHVGRNKEEKKAVMLIKADTRITDEIIQKIVGIESIGIKEGKYIEIEE